MMIRNAIAVLSFATAVPCAFAVISQPSGLSDALRVPAGERLAFVLDAHGAQIYICEQGADDPATYRWKFLAPEATLLENDEPVGFHGAGPVWEALKDKSSVKGAVRARQDGGAGNIPWLLLAASSSEGSGKFAGVTSIQRVATKGGVEPGAECNAGRVGREARVKYTAQYYFYKRS